MTKKNDLYIIKDNDTGIIAASGLTKEVAEQYVREFNEDFAMNMVMENATSAGAIAVNIGGGDGVVRRMPTLADYVLKKPNNKKKKKDLVITLGEKFDMDNIFSRLAGMERNGQVKKSEGTTFGIEDDNGNLMKVTVRAEQAKEFEEEVARYIADIRTSVEDLPVSQSAKEVSMAELLYKMRDKFDIIDVEFPKIPTDVVYNADKATPASDVASTQPLDQEGMGDDPMFGDDTGADGDELNLDMTQVDAGGDMDNTNMGDEFGDEEADIATDFEDETSDEGSILDKVIDMLKSQAEADIEKARADAERAKAEQARYTAQATQFAMRDEEERLRFELEQDEQKKREKEAKNMEAMAKHRIAKTMSVRESDEGMTPEMIMRQRQEITKKFMIQPNDSPETRQFKNIQKAEAMREWTSKYRQAMNVKRYNATMRDKQGITNKDQQQQLNPQQQQQQQQQGGNNEI